MSGSFDVFLSFSGAQRTYAKSLTDELVRACERSTIFYDQMSMENGESILKILEYAQKCTYFVVLVSEQYFRKSEYPMMELAASYREAKKGKGIPVLFPVFFGLSPKDAKDSIMQDEWQGKWDDWDTNEGMDKRKPSGPRLVQPKFWKEAVDQLFATYGPVYEPEKYGRKPRLFLRAVAQDIARMLKARSSSSQAIARLPPSPGKGPSEPNIYCEHDPLTKATGHCVAHYRPRQSSKEDIALAHDCLNRGIGSSEVQDRLRRQHKSKEEELTEHPSIGLFSRTAQHRNKEKTCIVQ